MLNHSWIPTGKRNPNISQYCGSEINLTKKDVYIILGGAVATIIIFPTLLYFLKNCL